MSFILKGFSSKPKRSTKATLGWIALGLIVFGLVLSGATSGGAVAGVAFIGGLLAGIVSLCLPKTAEEKAAKKRSNAGAIIALGIVVGLVILIGVALSNWH